MKVAEVPGTWRYGYHQEQGYVTLWGCVDCGAVAFGDIRRDHPDDPDDDFRENGRELHLKVCPAEGLGIGISSHRREGN